MKKELTPDKNKLVETRNFVERNAIGFECTETFIIGHKEQTALQSF